MDARLTAWTLTGLLVLARIATPAQNEEAKSTDEPLPKITVAAIEGDVEVKLANAKEWTPAKVGMELGQGAELQTHLFSWVELKLANDTTTKLNSVTRVRVDKYLKDAEAVRTRLRLRSGALSAVVNKGKLKSDFRVSSPQSTASVRGSELAWFGTAPWGDTLIVGDHGLFEYVAEQLGQRMTYAQDGQTCQVLADQILTTLETFANFQSPDMFPPRSTGRDRRNSVSTRRFGDVLPSDADDGVGAIPGIPQPAAPPPPSSPAAPTGALPTLRTTPEPPRPIVGDRPPFIP